MTLLADDRSTARGPLEDALEQLAEACDLLGYDEGTLRMLAAPRREVIR